MKKFIAYCGLDCEKCDAYKATQNNDNALREKVAKLWSEMNGVEITPEMINCEGCRVDGVKTPYCDSLCPIRQCALGVFLKNYIEWYAEAHVQKLPLIRIELQGVYKGGPAGGV